MKEVVTNNMDEKGRHCEKLEAKIVSLRNDLER